LATPFWTFGELLEKYAIPLPERVEQHNLWDAKEALGWEPQTGFAEFLEDLRERDSRGDDVRALWTPSDLSCVHAQ